MAHEWKTMGLGLLALAGAFAAEAGQAEVGKIINPGFELDADGNGLPDGWSGRGRARLVGCRRDASVKKEGRYSLRIASAKPISMTAEQAISVEPNALYRASVWVKTVDLEASTDQAVAGTVLVRARSTYFGTGRRHTGTCDWVEESVDFIAPSYGRVVLSCTFAFGGQAKGTAWFDEVRVVRLAPHKGIGGLKQPPRGAHALAEWAIRQTPVDYAALADALERFYAQPLAATIFDPEGIAKYHTALLGAAKAGVEHKNRVLALHGRCAWKAPLAILRTSEVVALIEEAAKGARGPGEQPNLARMARLAKLRLDAIAGQRPVEEAGNALNAWIGGDKMLHQEIVSLLSIDARILRRKGEHKAVARVCGVALALRELKDVTRLRTEASRLDALMSAGERAQATEAAIHLLAPDRKVSPNIRTKALETLVDLGLASSDVQQAKKWAGQASEVLAKHPACLSNFRLHYAQSLAAKKLCDEAIEQCRTVTACYPDQLDICFQAQKLIAACLLQGRDCEAALAAARVAYGVAPNSEKEITEAVNLVMRALKAKHQSLASANEFVAYQSHGPNGEDGKKSTEDDLKNPLAEVKYTLPPEVEALFKKTLAGLPTDFRGRRSRGYLYLYWGKSDLALKEFAQRYNDAPLQQKAVDEAIDDLVVALKAHHGHTLAGEQFMAYQKFGPKGKDGKSGTADDLTNPLAGLRSK